MDANDTLRCLCRNTRHCGERTICEMATDDGARCFYQRYLVDGEGFVDEMGCTNEMTCAISRSWGAQKLYSCCDSDFCNGQYANQTDKRSEGVDGPSPHWGLILLFGAFVACLIIAVALWAHSRTKRRRRVHSSGDESHDAPLSAVVAKPNSQSAAQPTLRERTVAMDIELGEIIGEGSFGKVYQATYMRGQVAVKIFQLGYYDYFAKETRIYTEAFGASKDENILGYKVHDTRNDELWLVTELCPLGSLHRYLDGRVVENVQLCLSFCKDIVSGLSYLHREERSALAGVRPAIAHRDLKPSNIFLRNAANGIQCVIGDFGYAAVKKDSWRAPARKDGETEAGDQGEVITDRVNGGTVRYMAPEVLSGTISLYNFDQFKMSDIYSLALVMWEIGMRTKVGDVCLERHVLPYEGIEIHSHMYTAVCRNGQRPAIPEFWNASEEMKELSESIQECWRQDPNHRLSASTVNKHLDEIEKKRPKERYAKTEQLDQDILSSPW